MPVRLNDREYRGIDVSGFETRTAEDGAMIVEGYATTFNQPYPMGESDKVRALEQVDARAFENADMSDVIMQYDHQGRVFARQSNGTLTLETDDHGLKITARLDGTEIGRQLYEEIVGGYTNRMSFGFTVASEEQTRVKGDDGKTIVTRTITGIKKLYDVSAVSLPANDATEISARSVGDGLIAEAEKEILADEERRRKIEQIRLMLEVSK